MFVTRVNSGGGHGPILLPGLGGFLHFAAFDVVVCAACGLTRFYTERSALAKLPKAKRWRAL